MPEDLFWREKKGETAFQLTLPMCFWTKGWHLSHFRTLLPFSGTTCVLKTYSCIIFKLTFRGDTASKIQPSWLGIAQETSETVQVIQLILQPCQRQDWLQTQPGLCAGLQVKPTNLADDAQPGQTLGSSWIFKYRQVVPVTPLGICCGKLEPGQGSWAVSTPGLCRLYMEIVWKLGSSGARTSSYLIILYLVQPPLHQQKHQPKRGLWKGWGGSGALGGRAISAQHTLCSAWAFPTARLCGCLPAQHNGWAQLLKWVQMGCWPGCSSTRIYGELREAWRGLWLGESGLWREQQMHCAAVLGQHLLSLPVLKGCHREGSISQTCSLTHPYHSLLPCMH